MGNDDQGHLAVECIDGLHDGGLRLIVQSGGRLIQHQDLRLRIQSPGDADPLPLTSGEADAPFPDHRLHALRQCINGLPQLSSVNGLPHPCRIHLVLWNPEGDVGLDRIVQQIDVLRNVANRAMPPVKLCGNVPLPGQNGASCGLQNPEDQICQRGLAGSRLSDQGHRGIHRNLQVQLLQHQLLRIRITE